MKVEHARGTSGSAAVTHHDQRSMNAIRF